MKKLVLTVATVLLMVSNSYSQTMERNIIATGVSGSYKVMQIIRNEKDTIMLFAWNFQNAKYSSITDIGGIYLYDQDEIDVFVNTLSKVASKEPGTNIRVDAGENSVYSYDFDKESIYISDKNGKYFIIGRKKADGIIAEILSYKSLIK
jgi:hypothetical protein